MGRTQNLWMLNLAVHLITTEPQWPSKVRPEHVMKAQKGSRGSAPLILNFGTKQPWDVNMTSWALYPREGNPVPSERRLGWPKGHSRRLGEEKSPDGPAPLRHPGCPKDNTERKLMHAGIMWTEQKWRLNGFLSEICRSFNKCDATYTAACTFMAII